MKKHLILQEFFSKANRLSIKLMAASIVLILCFGLSSAWGAKPVAKNGATLYVDSSAPADGDGMSWEMAFTDLQDALAAAVSGDQIWVAEGNYKPTSSSDRSVSFVLKSGVKIYGGFAGGEKYLRERSLDPGLTVLSGDIGTVGVDTDNSYHVVYAEGVTDAVLDGFTVTLGYGDTNSAGAGMYTINSLLTVSDCVFSQNKVAVKAATGMGYGRGGGMYNENSAVIVTNCTFSENQAGNRLYNKIGAGGGMYNKGGFVTDENDWHWPLITGCTFSDNVASSSWDVTQGGGGGMYNDYCSPTIDSCTFKRNLGGCGGAMLNFSPQLTITNCIFDTNSTNYYNNGLGGAIYNLARATILNCTFYQNGWSGNPLSPNTAVGGAIYDGRTGSTIANCIFIENAARGYGGAIVSAAVRPHTSLTNCLFNENVSWQGNPDPQYEVIDHIWGANIDSVNNLFNIDPLLVDPAGGDFHLRYDSPCIEAGFYGRHADVYWPFGLPVTDFEGEKRIVDADGDGVPNIDIGADEFMPNLPYLRAFLQSLKDSGDLDEATAGRLLAYVEEAQAALDQEEKKTAIRILNELIADAWKSLDDTEMAQLIEMKTKAVIEEI
jgi:hypothetical protein